MFNGFNGFLSKIKTKSHTNVELRFVQKKNSLYTIRISGKRYWFENKCGNLCQRQKPILKYNFIENGEIPFSVNIEK
jgi:hypothetical protein